MKAKTLMIQGTGSNVGKSVITAALCRKFFLDGWKVAPFKAQNMSLNSFVTEDGGEMGRAQVYQAEACGIKPHVTMNPVLLKPSGDNNSQVIVMGKVTENRNAKDYFAQRGKYFSEVEKALEHLRNEYELVVLEGAGSPAEVNLRDYDFVNMPMAKLADAPVLIVGDIDKGGVFAWMKGTFDLLTEEEQNRVQGFIINKFRGDVDLLKPGIDWFEKEVNKPVLGVIPFFRDLIVDEEDTIPAMSTPSTQPEKNSLKVSVIRWPRISNFTDFSPLAYDPSVSLEYVHRPSQLQNPDLIIIPGSKNILDDIEFIKAQGLDTAIRNCLASGTILLGICGGFQAMGQTIYDPMNLESRKNETTGLQLMDFQTTLAPQKITRQVKTSTLKSPVFSNELFAEGYEIHLGINKFHKTYSPLFKSEEGSHSSQLGITNEDGTLIGTYLHGFLDNDELRNQFLFHVRKLRGLEQPVEIFNYRKFREEQMNRLASLVCDHIDMNRIYELVNGKC